MALGWVGDAYSVRLLWGGTHISAVCVCFFFFFFLVDIRCLAAELYIFLGRCKGIGLSLADVRGMATELYIAVGTGKECLFR